MPNLLTFIVILSAFALILTQVILSFQLIERMKRLTARLDGLLKDRERDRAATPGRVDASPPAASPPAASPPAAGFDSPPATAPAVIVVSPTIAQSGPVAAALAPPEPEPESVPEVEPVDSSLAASLLKVGGREKADSTVGRTPPPIPTTAQKSEVRPRSARAWGLTEGETPLDAAPEKSRAPIAKSHAARLAPMADEKSTADRVRLELWLGRSIPVVVGSIALVLAGVWLVKLFAERGLFPPSARILFAGIFSLGLLGCGEWFRTRVERIARALIVSGLLVGYATIWAAERLYGFVGTDAVLVLFGAMTAAALLLGRRFGHWVTAVGLVGGFLIPALVGPEAYEPRTLFGCLALLQLGLATDRRVQTHSWLGTAAIIGSFGWVGVWLVTGSGLELRSPIAAIYLLLTTFVSVPSFCSREADSMRSSAIALMPGWLLAMAFYFSLGASTAGLVGIFVFALATVLTAAFRRGAWPFAAGAMLLSWLALITLGVPHGPPVLERQWFFGGVAAILVLFVGTPFLLALENARNRSYWAILSASSLAFSALLTWGRFADSPPPGGWGLWLFATALAAGGAAIALARGREDAGDDSEVIGFAWAATAIAAGAAMISLEGAEVSVAWSLLALLLVWIDRRTPLYRSMEWLVIPLILGSTARLTMNPALADYPIASHPILNWLPWGYGIPAIAAAFVGHWVGRGRRSEFAPFFWGISVLLGLVLVHLMVRHAFHTDAATLTGGGNPTEGESLAYSVTWIMSSLVLIGVSLWRRARALRYAGLAFMVAAVGKVFLWDTRSLEDFYRVASYFGLGVSLIGLSWAYHKLIPSLEERLARPQEAELATEEGAE